MSTGEIFSKYRRDLIQTEFREALTATEHEIPVDSDAIVVLSAAPLLHEDEHVITEGSPENIRRIAFGIQLAKEVASVRSGISIESINYDEILDYAPPLILNGETEQLPSMSEITGNLDFPLQCTIQVDCGPRGVGNTKTQIEAMNLFPEYRTLTFVTSAWHVPRTGRTVNANLKQEAEFKVIPVPQPAASGDSIDLIKTVLGEVRRIERYSAKGDISRDL